MIKKLYNSSFSYSLFIKYKFPPNILVLIRSLFFVILFLYLLAYGKEIFIRTDYLPETSRGLMVIIKILSFVEIILLGVIYHKHKRISSFYFFILILISIGTGSRTVFLFILAYIVLLFISQGNKLINKTKFAINIFLSILFLAYLMQLRSLESHGIIPYLKSITTSENDFLRDFYFNIYYSVIFGVYVTIETIQQAQADWNILFVSLNPLPGTIAGWYKYAEDMRLNVYAPYSLHGRVFKMGILFTIVYFFLTGLIFSFMENKIRDYLKQEKRILALLICLLLILHIVYGFEYNLRSAFRYIYYALLIILIVYLYKLIKPYLIKKS